MKLTAYGAPALRARSRKPLFAKRTVAVCVGGLGRFYMLCCWLFYIRDVWLSARYAQPKPRWTCMQFFFLLRCCFYVFQLLLVVSIARPEEGYQLRWCSLSLIHFYCLLLLSRLIFIFYCKRSFEAFLFLTHSRSPACFALSQTARLLLSQIDYAAILYFFFGIIRAAVARARAVSLVEPGPSKVAYGAGWERWIFGDLDCLRGAPRRENKSPILVLVWVFGI